MPRRKTPPAAPMAESSEPTTITPVEPILPESGAAPIAAVAAAQKRKDHHVRPTIEERIQKVAQQEAQARANLDALLQKLALKKQKLMERPEKRKQEVAERRKLDAVVARMVPAWRAPHMAAAIARSKDVDMALLLEEGETLFKDYERAAAKRRARRSQSQ